MVSRDMHHKQVKHKRWHSSFWVYYLTWFKYRVTRNEALLAYIARHRHSVSKEKRTNLPYFLPSTRHVQLSTIKPVLRTGGSPFASSLLFHQFLISRVNEWLGQ